MRASAPCPLFKKTSLRLSLFWDLILRFLLEIGSMSGEFMFVQQGIVRQVAASEAPVKPQPPFRESIFQELIVTKIRRNLVIITGESSLRK